MVDKVTNHLRFRIILEVLRASRRRGISTAAELDNLENQFVVLSSSECEIMDASSFGD